MIKGHILYGLFRPFKIWTLRYVWNLEQCGNEIRPQTSSACVINIIIITIIITIIIIINIISILIIINRRSVSLCSAELIG